MLFLWALLWSFRILIWFGGWDFGVRWSSRGSAVDRWVLGGADLRLGFGGSIDCYVLDGSCVAVIVAGMSGFVEIGFDNGLGLWILWLKCVGYVLGSKCKSCVLTAFAGLGLTLLEIFFSLGILIVETQDWGEIFGLFALHFDNSMDLWVWFFDR